jgi:hypothetical protein
MKEGRPHKKLFDPVEQVYSRYGETYGLGRGTFTRLAFLALSLARAGVGPMSIARLGAAGPGCDLVICGRRAVYAVRIGADRISLRVGSGGRDNPLAPGRLLFEGRDSFRDWFRVNDLIRIHERIENQAFAELDEIFDAQEDAEAPDAAE